MTKIIFDASAVLALLYQEPGHLTVEQHLTHAIISAVNFAEVMATLINGGISISQAERAARDVMKHIIPFNEQQALQTAALRKTTKSLGLSLGDRACLALAILEHLPVLTADKAWAKLDDNLKVKVILIR